jgi:hypothetical protein
VGVACHNNTLRWCQRWANIGCAEGVSWWGVSTFEGRYGSVQWQLDVRVAKGLRTGTEVAFECLNAN